MYVGRRQINGLLRKVSVATSFKNFTPRTSSTFLLSLMRTLATAEKTTLYSTRCFAGFACAFAMIRKGCAVFGPNFCLTQTLSCGGLLLPG